MTPPPTKVPPTGDGLFGILPRTDPPGPGRDRSACRGYDTFFLTREWELTAAAFLCNDDRDP
jgi:hypothetical protein